MGKNHFAGVLAFGVLTVMSLTLLYGVEPGRELVQVNQRLSAEVREPVKKGPAEKKQIALTFDAAQAGDDAEGVLELLEENGAAAAFFVSGEWAERHPEQVRAILEAGHDLGSLGQTGTDMRGMTEDECRQSLLSVHNLVRDLTGYEMCLFRPPMGKYDGRLLECAEAAGYVTVQGDVDSMDWKDYGPEETARTVLENSGTGSGSIVIFRLGEADTEAALELVIRGLSGRGYGLVSLSGMGIGR